MTVIDLLPYLFTMFAVLAVWVGVRRTRALRNGAFANGQTMLEKRIQECEATINTLLRDNVRKETEIQRLAQELQEAQKQIWLLRRQLEVGGDIDSKLLADRLRVSKMEQADRITAMMAERRELLLKLEEQAAQFGVPVPADIVTAIANERATIERYEKRLAELLGQ